MEKNIVKLNEEQLKNIVIESVKRILKEEFDNNDLGTEKDFNNYKNKP